MAIYSNYNVIKKINIFYGTKLIYEMPEESQIDQERRHIIGLNLNYDKIYVSCYTIITSLQEESNEEFYAWIDFPNDLFLKWLFAN